MVFCGRVLLYSLALYSPRMALKSRPWTLESAGVFHFVGLKGFFVLFSVLFFKWETGPVLNSQKSPAFVFWVLSLKAWVTTPTRRLALDSLCNWRRSWTADPPFSVPPPRAYHYTRLEMFTHIYLGYVLCFQLFICSFYRVSDKIKKKGSAHMQIKQ